MHKSTLNNTKLYKNIKYYIWYIYDKDIEGPSLAQMYIKTVHIKSGVYLYSIIHIVYNFHHFLNVSSAFSIHLHVLFFRFICCNYIYNENIID